MHKAARAFGPRRFVFLGAHDIKLKVSTRTEEHLMRLIGSFTRYEPIGEQIRRERRSFLLRRQVVSVLLISRDGKRICLEMSERAFKDSRYNMSPPQGGIEVGESVYDAAARELKEELDVTVSPAAVVYISSVVRQLPEDDKHRPRFVEAHHHWVAAHVSNDKLSARPPQAAAGWYPIYTISSQAQLYMSPTKGEMTVGALKELTKRVKDQEFIRPETLLDSRDALILGA